MTCRTWRCSAALGSTSSTNSLGPQPCLRSSYIRSQKPGRAGRRGGERRYLYRTQTHRCWAKQFTPLAFLQPAVNQVTTCMENRWESQNTTAVPWIPHLDVRHDGNSLER